MYHANKTGEDEKSPWLMLDHCAIFIMIAGSYVGPLYIYAPANIRLAVLGAVWFFALAGAALKLRYLISPNWINVAIYAPIGIISLVPMALLWTSVDSIPLHGVSMSLLKSLLVGGLAVYALGGAVYALKRPDPIAGTHRLPRRVPFSHSCGRGPARACPVFFDQGVPGDQGIPGSGFGGAVSTGPVRQTRLPANKIFLLSMPLKSINEK